MKHTSICCKLLTLTLLLSALSGCGSKSESSSSAGRVISTCPVGWVSPPPYSKPTLNTRSPFCKSPMRSTSSPRGRRCAVTLASSTRVNRAPSLTSPQTGQSVKS